MPRTPLRSFRLRHLFRKSVTIYSRAAPALVLVGGSFMHSLLFFLRSKISRVDNSEQLEGVSFYTNASAMSEPLLECAGLGLKQDLLQN